MKKNNLYTKSYFTKRIRDRGYLVSNEALKYPEDDIRKWTIIVEPNKYAILCTCYKMSPSNFWFKFDGQQKSNIIVTTLSMETVIATLEDIISGHDLYNNLKTEV